MKTETAGGAVLLTGDAGGMGQAAALALTKAGYGVIGLDLRRPSGEVPWRHMDCDLTSEEDVASAAEALGRENVRLTAVLHHAGIYLLDSLLEIPARDFSRLMEINLGAVCRVNRLLLPLLGAGARIVIVSSELAPLDPLPFTGLYGLSKTALEAYAKSLRMEAQLLGIRVTVIRPGAVRTGLLDDSQRALARFTERTKLYPVNAERFRRIVERVETRAVPPERVAALDLRILRSRRPRYTYCLNRNPGLLLLSALPLTWQTAVIRRILTGRSGTGKAADIQTIKGD